MADEPFESNRSCARAREWVSLRADGELSEIERLLLRRHLARCEGCRAFAGAVTAATGAIRSTPLERPSRALEPDQPRVRERRRRVRYRLAAVGAVVAIGAGVGGVVATSGGESSPGGPRTGTEIAQVTPPPPPPPVRQPPGQNV
jgi:predicted anti-sigma-YlaC factor YlaD